MQSLRKMFTASAMAAALGLGSISSSLSDFPRQHEIMPASPSRSPDPP